MTAIDSTNAHVHGSQVHDLGMPGNPISFARAFM